MPINHGYATLDEFKAYSTVRGEASSTDAADDKVIEGLIEGVSRYIDHQAGRHFYKSSSDEVRYYVSEDGESLFVDDLVSITALGVDTSLDQSYATSLSSSEYDLYPLNAALDSKPYTWLEMAVNSTESLATSRKGNKVTGVWGFPAVPDDIREVCLAIVLNIYQSRSGQSSGGNVTVTAAGVVIRPADVPAWAKQVIDKYRRLIR